MRHLVVGPGATAETGADLRQRVVWPAPHRADLTALGERPNVLPRRHGAAGRKTGRSGVRPEARPPSTTSSEVLRMRALSAPERLGRRGHAGELEQRYRFDSVERDR